MMQLTNAKVWTEVKLNKSVYDLLVKHLENAGDWNEFIESAIKAALLKKLADRL